MGDGLRAARQTDAADASVVAVCGLAFEAAIAAGPGVMTLCGPGGGSLTTRFQALLAQHGHACRGIISFGTAGGLDPVLKPGDCVLAEHVVTPDRDFPVDGDWLQALHACLPEARIGTLAGVDHPVADIEAKARLWRSSGACAVDMESHCAALLAQRHGLPFVACRVIVDHCHRHVPSAAIVGIAADGTVSLSRLLGELVVHPGQLAGCIRLACDAAAARRRLRAVRLATGAAFAVSVPIHRLTAGSGPFTGL